jgi:hypothetical protein
MESNKCPPQANCLSREGTSQLKQAHNCRIILYKVTFTKNILICRPDFTYAATLLWRHLGLGQGGFLWPLGPTGGSRGCPLPKVGGEGRAELRPGGWQQQGEVMREVFPRRIRNSVLRGKREPSQAAHLLVPTYEEGAEGWYKR